MMRKLAFVFELVGLIACAGSMSSKVELTEQDREFLDRLDSAGTTFALPPDVSDIAWERARSFIDRNSWTMVHSVTETEIRTFNPPAGGDHFGYIITRMKDQDSHHFNVECVAGSSAGVGTAFRNARILAHYMKTGELPQDKRLIAK